MDPPKQASPPKQGTAEVYKVVISPVLSQRNLQPLPQGKLAYPYIWMQLDTGYEFIMTNTQNANMVPWYNTLIQKPRVEGGVHPNDPLGSMPSSPVTVGSGHLDFLALTEESYL